MEQRDVEEVLDYLWYDIGWTCPMCHAGNGGAYRLACKYCEGVHPLADTLRRLWRDVGRVVDADGELEAPAGWPGVPTGIPRHHPPGRS